MEEPHPTREEEHHVGHAKHLIAYLNDVGIAEERAEFFRQYAVQGTVMVVGVNEALLPMVYNMLCSWHAFDATAIFPNLVVWALHLGAVQPITELRDKLGASFGIYHMEQYNVSAAADRLELGSDDYYKAMKLRGVFWLSFLQTGLNLLFADADIVFFKDPIADLTSRRGYGSVGNIEGGPAEVDVVVSTDGRDFDEGPILRRGTGWATQLCAGLWWMRSNARTINLVKSMIKIMDDTDWLNDQDALNRALEDEADWVIAEHPFLSVGPRNNNTREANRTAGVNVRVLDQVRYVSGWLYMWHRQKYEERLQQGTWGRRTQAAIHVNYWRSDKTELMKQAGLWFVDDSGACMAHTR